MVTLRLVKNPGLLVRTAMALGMSQAQFGKLLGVSRRTIIRWHGGKNGPSWEDWIGLARHVYAVNPAIAREIAVELGETLVSLGIEQPPPPPPPPPAPPQAPAPPSRPVPPLADMVDSIVCAAAEAVGAAPQAVRPSLLAAFERAASVGLGVDEVRAVLAASAKAKPSKSSGSETKS